MRARRYQDKDYEMVLGWMQKRGLKWVPKSWLPKRGFIVDDVAVVFLIKTDCKLGMMDFFASNPDATEAARLEAYDLGYALLEAEAKKLKMVAIYCNTQLPKVMGVVLRLGYRGDPTPFYGFRKSLVEPEIKREEENAGSNAGIQ